MNTFNEKPHLSKWFAQCKDCKSRTPGCHGECEPYQKELKRYRSFRNEEKKGRRRYMDATFATESGREDMGYRA